MSELRPNPYLIICPHCAGVLCARCASMDARQTALADGDGSRRGAIVDQSLTIHLGMYEHSPQLTPAAPVDLALLQQEVADLREQLRVALLERDALLCHGVATASQGS